MLHLKNLARKGLMFVIKMDICDMSDTFWIFNEN